MTSLQALRKRIAEVKSDMRDVQSLPRSHAETESSIRQHLQQRHDAGARQLRHQLAVFATGDVHTGFLRLAGGDLADVLLPLLGVDGAMQALAPHLEQLPEGISDAERKAQMAELANAQFDAEVAEELAVCALEARGEDVSRRPDADPRAVLMVAP